MSDVRARAIHAHPFSILTFLYRFLFLLIIPLARGFISALTGDIFSWVRGAWFDILIVALIIILAYQKWEHFQYHMDINGVYIATGIFFRSEFYIPQDRISTLSVIRPFWLRPFRIARIRIDTIAGDPRSPDAAFYVWSREADRISSLRAAPPAMDSDGAPAQDRPHLYELVLLSLLTSNSFIGIVFIATFFSHMGQILGEELSGILVTTFEELSRRIAFGLPPIFAGAALLLLCGWLVAFCISLLQVKNLFVCRSENTLHVSGGVLVQKEYSLRRDDVSFIDIRQSLTTRLLRLYSVYINAIGFAKDKKSDIAAVIPFSSKKRTQKRLALLLPEYRLSQRTLKPNGGAIFKFIIEPLWPCLLIPAGTIAACWLLPSWVEIIRFAGFMLCLPAFWFLGVRLLDFASSGVSCCENYYTLRYSKLYHLHTVVFSYDKISLINIRQSILQRGDDKCDLVISTRAEGHMRHHIRNLDRSASLEIFRLPDFPIVMKKKRAQKS